MLRSAPGVGCVAICSLIFSAPTPVTLRASCVPATPGRWPPSPAGGDSQVTICCFGFCLSTHFPFACRHQRFRNALTPYTVSRVSCVPPVQQEVPVREALDCNCLTMPSPTLHLARSKPR